MTCFACCYTISPDFILQALVSASQVRRFTDKDQCDIIIFCFGALSSRNEDVRDFCSTHHIVLIEISPLELMNLPLSCARLLICPFFPKRYDAIAYLDADTQVCSSIIPLLRTTQAKIPLLAAADPMALIADYSGRIGRSSREHLKKINRTSDDSRFKYFNSGVLSFSPGSWEAICSEALSLMQRHSGEFRYIDQDALNIVVGGRHGQISLKWNYPGFLLGLKSLDVIDKSIVHFMSNPRPWDGPFEPWGPRWNNPYVDLSTTLPSLVSVDTGYNRFRYFRYLAQTTLKRKIERRTWESIEFQDAVLNNEKAAIV